MTVSTTNNRVSYAGNGVTTVFSFPNKFLADADLVVLDVLDSTGAETTKTLTTHYTVSGAGDEAGGSVTMLTAPAAGRTLVIYRDPALTQPIDLVNGDPLNVETGIERGLDRAATQIQRVRDLIDRTMGIPDGDTGLTAADMKLPAIVSRASKYLAFDANGKPIAAAAQSGTVPVTAFAATMLDDVDGAAVVDTLIASATNNAILTKLEATRSETGAAAVPLLDITRRVINVHDFGAVGDGTTDDSTAIQNAINAAKAIPGGSVEFQPKAYNLGTTGITVTGTGVSGSGVVLNGQARRFVGSALFGTELLYSGTGVAVLFGQDGVINYNCGINKIQIRASGGATSSATAVGLKLINSHYFDSDQLAIKDFSSGVGLLFQPSGTSMFGATTQWRGLLVHLCKVGVQSIGVDANIKDNHAIFLGGAVIGDVSAGSIGFDLRQYSDGYLIYGTDVESFETGIKCDGGAHRFIGARTEFCTAAVNLTANSIKNAFIGQQFGGGTTYTDSGTLNYRYDDEGLFGKLPIRPSANAGEVLQVMKADGTTLFDLTTSGTPKLELVNGLDFVIYSDNFTTRRFRVNPSGGLEIGNGGGAIARHLTGTATWDPPSIAVGASVTTTVTVTGATTGGNVPTVAVGFDQSLQGLTLTGYVSAADTVTVVLFNGTAGAVDLSSGYVRADVWEH